MAIFFLYQSKFSLKIEFLLGEKTTHIQLLFYLEKDNLKVAHRDNRPKLTTDFWSFHSRRQNQRKRSRTFSWHRPSADCAVPRKKRNRSFTSERCHSVGCEQPTTLLNVSRNARDRHGSLVEYVLVPMCSFSLVELKLKQNQKPKTRHSHVHVL